MRKGRNGAGLSGERKRSKEWQREKRETVDGGIAAPLSSAKAYNYHCRGYVGGTRCSSTEAAISASCVDFPQQHLEGRGELVRLLCTLKSL